MRLVIDKIAQQWRSIKTAFTKINCEKSGSIEREELQVALKNWGLFLDQEKFEHVYQEFDHDKDGVISYGDFKKTIGEIIQPEENLYFRQDNPKTIILNAKEQKNCWREDNKVSINYLLSLDSKCEEPIPIQSGNFESV